MALVAARADLLDPVPGATFRVAAKEVIRRPSLTGQRGATSQSSRLIVAAYLAALGGGLLVFVLFRIGLATIGFDGALIAGILGVGFALALSDRKSVV